MLILVNSAAYSAVIADDEIKLSATTMRPGDFIKIAANEPANAVVEIRFLDATKQLQVYNNQFLWSHRRLILHNSRVRIPCMSK